MEGRKLTSVTIGIPAYNEEKNITFLLDSLLKQKGEFLVKKIVVLSDASTDRTDEKVLSYAKQYPHIALVSDGNRLGKAKRLNQLYRMNTNDFIIIFDGDVLIDDDRVIEKLLKRFISDSVAFVGGNIKPMPETTHFEKLINTWNGLWYDVVKDINNGNTVHNVYGRIIALRKNFAHSILFPEGTVSEPQYLYFSAKSQDMTFVFAKDAYVYYGSPTTLSDYKLQYNRHFGELKKNASIFGEWIYTEFAIPRKNKIYAFLHRFLKTPMRTCMAVVFHVWFRMINDKRPSIKQPGIWEVVISTKRQLKFR